MASSRIRRNNNLGSLLTSLDQTTNDLNARQNYLTTGLASQSVTSSSLPEELILSNRTIQTENYVEGSSGWRISGDGGAEFASVIVRGDINAYSGTIGYWNISSPAVSRLIGPYNLLGTFIESLSTGNTDIDVTTGSYVGLYKSYSPEPVLVTVKIRESNISTLTSENHEFVIGDLVTISLEDDTTFNNGGIPVEITAVTNNTFSYNNAGSNVSESSATGFCQLYNPDVAGLYLQDYGKRDFDYGYFSNTGIAYVSAEDINLIENPSFEYKSSSNVVTYSEASWSNGIGLYLNSKDFTANSSFYYNASPKFGANITWTTSVSTYFSGTIDYLAGSDYAVFINNKNIYLGLKLFPEYTPANVTVTRADGVQLTGSLTSANSTATTVVYSGSSLPFEAGQNLTVTGFSDSRCNVSNALITVANSTSVTVLSSGDSNVSATSSTSNNAKTGLIKLTATSHGFTANDLAFLDFDFSYFDENFGETLTIPHTIADGTEGYTYKVLSYGITANIFYVPSDSSSIPTIELTKVSHGGRAQKAYKVYETAFDLSSIRFRYQNGNTTPISNVLSDGTLAEWNSGVNKYLISKANSYMLGRLDTTVKIPSMSSTGEIVLSAQKLADAYYANDPASYVTKADVLIDFPGWLVSHDGNGVVANSAAKISNLGYILDEVYLSTSNSFFYGAGGGSNRWYATTDTTPSYDPAQASIEGTKTWINVDLENQSAYLDYFDYLKFRPLSFTKALKERASIGVFDDVNPYITISDENPEITTFTGGQYEYPSGAYYKNVSSHVKTTIGERSSAFEISSLYRLISTSTGNEENRKGALVGGIYDGVSGVTKLYLSSDTFSWSADYISPTNEAYSDVIFTASRATYNIPLRVNGDFAVTGTTYSSGSIVTTAGNFRTSNGDIYTKLGDIYTENGGFTANTIRLTSTFDVNTTSTLHAFQIGPTTGTNLRIDSNEIQALNNGAASDLNLQASGGNVNVGSNIYVTSVVYSGQSIYTEGVTTTSSWQSSATDFAAIVNGSIHAVRSGSDPLRLSRQNNGAIASFYRGNTTAVGTISVNATATTYNTSSDYRLKENVVPITGAIERLLQLKPSRFNFKVDPEHTVDGFIAHEAAEVVPQAVEGVKDEVDEDGNPVYQGIDHSMLVPLLTAALQEAVARIKALEEK